MQLQPSRAEAVLPAVLNSFLALLNRQCPQLLSAPAGIHMPGAAAAAVGQQQEQVAQQQQQQQLLTALQLRCCCSWALLCCSTS